jgi:CubicO group peptidase (beta-lactamase class C family)
MPEYLHRAHRAVRWIALASLHPFLLAPGAHAEGSGALRKGDAVEVGFNAERLDRALKFVERAVESGKIAGAGVLVARRGVVVAERGYGTADVEKKRPFTTDTIYPIASISKTIAATAAMILVEEGKLGLDDPVERYLPAFREQMFKTAAGDLVHRLITVRHLMTHTSGLPPSPLRHNAPRREWFSRSLDEAVAASAKEPLVFEPGTQAQYRDINFDTLGRIIEVVSNQPYDVFVSQRVFEPLGMKSSFYNVPKALAGRVADGFYYMKGGKLLGPEPHDPDFRIVNAMPSGGVSLSASDLAIFLQTFLNGGAYGSRRILAPRTARMMLADQTRGLESHWGLGWMLGTGSRDGGASILNEEVFGHPGAGRCLAWGDPRKELIGVLLMRPGHADDSLSDLWDGFQHLVYAALEDAQKESRTNRPSLPAPGLKGRRRLEAQTSAQRPSWS